MSAHAEDAAEMARLLADAKDDGKVTCDNCGCEFLVEDMSAFDCDYCWDCAEELCGGDE